MTTGDLPIRVRVVQVGNSAFAIPLDHIEGTLGPGLTEREIRLGTTNRITDLRSAGTDAGWAMRIAEGHWTELVLVDAVIGTGTWCGGRLIELDEPASFELNQLACSSELMSLRNLGKPEVSLVAA